MAKSTLMRVSIESADKVKERAKRNDRTQVAEMDRIIAAGIAVLDKIETKPTFKRGDLVLRRGVPKDQWRGGVIRCRGRDVYVESTTGFEWMSEELLERWL